MSFFEPLRSRAGKGPGFTEARQMNADVIVSLLSRQPVNKQDPSTGPCKAAWILYRDMDMARSLGEMDWSATQ